MEFGIQHGMGDPNWQPAILQPQAVRNFARSVDAAGYSHLAFTDHPSPSVNWVKNQGEGVAELFTALGFCAAVTERIRLLTWTLVLPFHNPIALAHRIATLDALSAGRVTLGLGLGYLKSEFYAQGADFDNRHAVYDHHLHVMLAALRGEPINADGPDLRDSGPTFSARNVCIEPPLIQQPHPPLWMYGNSPFGLERAARLGQGWIGMFTNDQVVKTIRTTPLPDTDTLALRLQELDIQLATHGRCRGDIDITLTNVVPLIDIRKGWNKDAYQQRFAELAALGVQRVVVNALGDDPVASEESALKFAEDFICS